MFPVITTQAKYWWLGLCNGMREWMITCDECQRLKKVWNASFNSGQIKMLSKTTLFELVSIDICWPLPQASNENRYTVIMIDKISRFCPLIPVSNVETMTIIKAYHQWANLFGAPQNFVSDKGA